MTGFPRTLAFVITLLLVAAPARAQDTTEAKVDAPPRLNGKQWLAKHLWIVGGAGYAVARAGCDTCDLAGVYHDSVSVTVTGGVHATPRVDAGIEAHWVALKVTGGDAMRTTFILATAQVRPWVERGLFFRTGMGIGIVGRGLWSPIGPALAPPYTTNALALVYGTGWTFKVKNRWAVQAHATHYVASLGELTRTDGTTMTNVVGNYWTIGMAIVVR
jgi:hypothetical protein